MLFDRLVGRGRAAASGQWWPSVLAVLKRPLPGLMTTFMESIV